MNYPQSISIPFHTMNKTALSALTFLAAFVVAFVAVFYAQECLHLIPPVPFPPTLFAGQAIPPLVRALSAFVWPTLAGAILGFVMMPPTTRKKRSTDTCQIELFTLGFLGLCLNRSVLKWDRNAFCRGWLITGGTGAGKTESGINKIVHNLCVSEIGEVREDYAQSSLAQAEKEFTAKAKGSTGILVTKMTAIERIIADSREELNLLRGRMVEAEMRNGTSEKEVLESADIEARLLKLDEEWGALDEQERTIRFESDKILRRAEMQKFKVPPWGGLAIDEKGSWYQILQKVFRHYGRLHHLCLVQTRPGWAKPSWKPESRFNLLGDNNTNADAYAKVIVDTAQGVEGGGGKGGGGGNASYFITQAATHIAGAIKLDRAIRDHNRETNNLPHEPDTVNSPNNITAFPNNDHLPNLKHCHKLLTDKTYLVAYCNYYKKRCEHEPERWATLLLHIDGLTKNYLGLAKDTWASVMGNIGNYLNYFIDETVSEVFCTDSTFAFSDIDRGMMICVAMPQKLAKHRQYVCTILKLLFYAHARIRFDQKRDERGGWNLLICLQDESQRFVQEQDGDVDILRESQCTTIMATQSKGALKAALGNEKQAQVLISNLCSRFIFAPANNECAQESADFLGKRKREKCSRSVSKQGTSRSYSDEYAYQIEPSEMGRLLPKFHAIVCHPDAGWKIGYLPPVTTEGKLPSWVGIAVKSQSLKVRWLVWLHKYFYAKSRE